MKTCSSCFRYCENWRDAKAKGMRPVYYHGFAEYFYRPRPGVKLHALGINCPDDDALHPAYIACEYHEYRWIKNLKTWWEWHFKQSARGWYRKFIRVPIGGLRKPVPLEWRDSFDGMADRIIPNGEPICPRCGEMPYNYAQCAFCGQRFIPDDSNPDKTAPQPPLKQGQPIIFTDGICPECGCSCGNGGYGPLRCRCGWVGSDELSEEVKKTLEEMFADKGCDDYEGS